MIVLHSVSNVVITKYFSDAATQEHGGNGQQYLEMVQLLVTW